MNEVDALNQQWNNMAIAIGKSHKEFLMARIQSIFKALHSLKKEGFILDEPITGYVRSAFSQDGDFKNQFFIWQISFNGQELNSRAIEKLAQKIMRYYDLNESAKEALDVIQKALSEISAILATGEDSNFFVGNEGYGLELSVSVAGQVIKV